MATCVDKMPSSVPGNRNKSSPCRQECPIMEQQEAGLGEATNSHETPTNSARRPGTKTSNALNKRPINMISLAKQKRELENQYSTKKKRFMVLKRELMQKQKTTQELYEDISQLRDKLITSGAKDPGKLDELKLVEIDSSKITVIESKAQSGYGEQGTTTADVDNPDITSEFIVTLKNKLKEISKSYQDLCEEALSKHSGMITFLEEKKPKEVSEDPEESKDKASQLLLTLLDSFREENESLKSRLEGLKSTQFDIVAELVKNTYDLYGEYEKSRARLKELTSTLDEQKDFRERLVLLADELQAEREKHNTTKERRAQTENQLQRARTKIRDLENRVSGDETKIQQLQAQNRSLESQLKQKEQAMEQRLKDMQKTMKNSENLVAKMEKQRDSFEARLVELKETMNTKETAAANTIKNMNDKMEVMIAELEQEKKKRQEVENELVAIQDRYKELEATSQEMCKLLEQSKNFAITDGSHTENEIRLFNDLKVAREELEEQKVMMAKLRQEKEEIAAVMHQAASDAEEESKDKLAVELMNKSKEVHDIALERNHLQRIADNLEKRNKLLEDQLLDIQNRLLVQSKEGEKVTWGSHVVELQQQISDLRNSLTEATAHNAELETALTQKQLELEQRDRIMREQSKFLKVRDELLGLLKGKEVYADRDTSNDDEHHKDLDEINKQIIAKTEAIQELYASLESKQMQVMRLEKIVKQMEDHQDHAQAQRTRLENRIAQLELALQEKNHRYVRKRSSTISASKSAARNDHEKSFHKVSDDYKGALLRPMMPPTLRRSLNLHSSSRSASMMPQGQQTTRSSSLIRDHTAKSRFFPFSKSASKAPNESGSYICKRCRHEEQRSQEESIFSISKERNPNDEIRESLYNWLLESTELEITDNLPKQFYSSSSQGGTSSLSSFEETLQFANIVYPHLKRDRSENVNFNCDNINRDHHRSPQASSKTIKQTSSSRHTPFRTPMSERL